MHVFKDSMGWMKNFWMGNSTGPYLEADGAQGAPPEVAAVAPPHSLASAENYHKMRTCRPSRTPLRRLPESARCGAARGIPEAVAIIKFRRKSNG